MAKSASEIAVVGAGPYGLSIAANLVAKGRNIRVFGTPMQTWSSAMPQGMKLKSDGFASNLIAPAPGFTLEDYCAENAIPYHHKTRPVELATFVAYGREFQRRFVPNLEQADITSVDREGDGFRLVTTTGETLFARQVVLAVGVTHFRTLPGFLTGLPDDLVSHSADHHDFARFAGRRVTVLGVGSSGTDVAGALIAAGAKVTLVARSSKVVFNDPPTGQGRSLMEMLRKPSTPLGPGWRSKMSSDLPWLFRYLSDDLRLRVVKRHLGPRSAWYLRDVIMQRADVRTSQQVIAATAQDGALRLSLKGADGAVSTIDTDHLIAATGYWPQVEQLKMLSPTLRGAIDHVEGVPKLSANFESSVPGLYFTGLASAGSFGPLMRFVAGAGYTTHRLCRHLARKRTGVPAASQQVSPQVEST